MNASDRPRVLCVGETMAMVVPQQRESAREARDFFLGEGGAESTVAMYLADFGAHASWFSALGTDPLGDRILDALSRRGVDVSLVRRDARHRTGLYVKDPRGDGTSVYYYRDGSAASRLDRASLAAVDLGAYDLVHTSGITAALSPGTAGMVDALFAQARETGTATSFDVNFRPGLWPAEAAAPQLLSLARRADVVLVGRDEAEQLWGAGTAGEIAELLALPPSRHLVVKDADVGATEITGDSSTFEPALPVEVIEHVGAGDAFAAGYLAALLDHAEPHRRLAAGHRTAAWTLGAMVDYRPLPTSEACWAPNPPQHLHPQHEKEGNTGNVLR